MSIGPLTTRVVMQKAALLDEIADVADALERADEAGFTDVIRSFIEAGFTPSRIAHHTSVDCSAVTRWSQGAASPRAGGRPIIAKHLAKIARRRADEARMTVLPKEIAPTA